MYESSPRSREVANALFQIDRLSQDQTRAILRHIAIDDAALNEAQCSHVACVINGTLNKAPREGVNATLTCGTSLDAASHWEKSFASHPGHVSAKFHKSSTNNEGEADQSTQQVVLFKPEKTAAAATNDAPSNARPSVGFPPDLKGLSIINQGHLTLHYHSYNEVSSLAAQPAKSPSKRALERKEDEEYSEALSSLMEFDLSPQNDLDPVAMSKRRRLEEPEPEKVEPEQVEPEQVEPEAQEHQKRAKKEKEQQKKASQEEYQPVQWNTQDTGLCKKCGKIFKLKTNNGKKLPCSFHPGTVKSHPNGLIRTKKNGAHLKTLYEAWTCCLQGPNSHGCVREKHDEDGG